MEEGLSGIEKLLGEIHAQGPDVTIPGGWVSRDGDCVFYFNKGNGYTRERVDNLLTVFRDDSQEIIGVAVKGFKNLPPHDILGIMVEQGEVEVVTLLLVTYHRMVDGRSPERARVYSEAITSLGGRVRTQDLLPT